MPSFIARDASNLGIHVWLCSYPGLRAQRGSGGDRGGEHRNSSTSDAVGHGDSEASKSGVSPARSRRSSFGGRGKNAREVSEGAGSVQSEGQALGKMQGQREGRMPGDIRQDLMEFLTRHPVVLKGVGPKKAQMLAKLGKLTVQTYPYLCVYFALLCIEFSAHSPA